MQKATRMTQTTPARKVVLCSPISEQSGEDPAGSAWATSRILVAELPLPWPENFLLGSNLPAGLAAVVSELYATVGAAWGFIGIAPDPDYSVPGLSRLFDLRQPADGIGTYQRDSYLVPADELAGLIRTLAFDPRNVAIEQFREPDDRTTRDLLICTHGSVDACCATFGIPVYKLLRAMAAQAETPTRVWRCTHFGGHRFAATALDLPDGRYWGHLKADMLSKLVHKRVPAHELRRHYRGWAALADPFWQIAEAEILATAGWGWTDATITAIDGQTTPEEGGVLSVTFTHPATGASTVDIAIKPAGSVTTMDSSKIAEFREAPQYRASITRQSPTGCMDQLASMGRKQSPA